MIAVLAVALAGIVAPSASARASAFPAVAESVACPIQQLPVEYDLKDFPRSYRVRVLTQLRALIKEVRAATGLPFTLEPAPFIDDAPGIAADEWGSFEIYGYNESRWLTFSTDAPDWGGGSVTIENKTSALHFLFSNHVVGHPQVPLLYAQLLHEFAQMLGLRARKAPGTVMNPFVINRFAHYTASDIAGLRRLAVKACAKARHNFAINVTSEAGVVTVPVPPSARELDVQVLGNPGSAFELSVAGLPACPAAWGYWQTTSTFYGISYSPPTCTSNSNGLVTVSATVPQQEGIYRKLGAGGREPCAGRCVFVADLDFTGLKSPSTLSIAASNV